jgi:hypothetical protein
MSPSYWHGWSPDGKWLAYCAQREGKYGIFTIPVDGGTETRLTTTEGLDDGPDFPLLVVGQLQSVGQPLENLRGELLHRGRTPQARFIKVTPGHAQREKAAEHGARREYP